MDRRNPERALGGYELSAWPAIAIPDGRYLAYQSDESGRLQVSRAPPQLASVPDAAGRDDEAVFDPCS